MNRAWAGLGAVSGVGVGAVVGSAIGERFPGRDQTPIESTNVGMAIGVLVGAFTGAAIGAGGGGAPKQVGTAGVGALPKGIDGGFFP